MADTGSVASVASAGLRLALLLNAVACQVANLGVDIHSISKGITLFSTSLKQARQSLQSEHSVHTQECLDTANQISEQALTVFEEVEDMLDEVQKPNSQATEGGPQSVQQRFKTCFKKQRVTYLLAQLESLKFSLMVIVQVLQLGRLVEVKNVLNTLTEELIAQERADAQNMLIVRYWSTKKLDRLWDLARQEAKEDRAPTVKFESSTASTQDLPSPTSPGMSKLPIIPLGVESSLNAVEESPKDMLRLTGTILDALLKRWIREEVGQRLVTYDANTAVAAAASSPHAFVSSGSEDGYSDDGYGRPDMQGYYLEGTTADWRKPHSQDARTQAAQLRKLYSTKQAHVHSDSEDSDSSTSSMRRETKRKNRRPAATGDGQYTTARSSGGEPAPRPYSYSVSNKVPGSDTESNWRHKDTVNTASQTRPIPVPQPNNVHTNGLYPVRPPTSSPSSNVRNGVHQHHHQTYYSTAPNGFLSTTPTGGSQSYQQQPRFTPAPPPTRAFSRSMSDNISQPQQYLAPQQQQQQQQPAPPQRHRSSRSRKGYHSPQPYDRHRDLKRTAMRGILGASAIGGFMDALEAFSVI